MQAHYKAIATPSQAGAHVDPAVAAHHAKIEQYQALVADAPDTPERSTTGPSPERGRRSNQEAERYKQQATMAALQNSSKWEATAYAA
jgi:hypothetical protein